MTRSSMRNEANLFVVVVGCPVAGCPVATRLVMPMLGMRAATTDFIRLPDLVGMPRWVGMVVK